MKFDVHLFWITDETSKNGGRYSFMENLQLNGYQNDYGNSYKHLATAEVEFDISSFDPREQLIGSLQKKREAIIAKSARDIAYVDDRIQQLLALPSA